MAIFRVLDHIEGRFDGEKAREWMSKYWFVSVIVSIVYLVLIFVGKQAMKNRPAFQMRRALLMWNTGLAAFSTIGSIILVPELIHKLIYEDFYMSVCKVPALKHPPLNIWGWLFIISKFLELGDTVFIVLRKTSLQFLHWYHHVTVLIYTWFANSYSPPSAVGLWFASMNYAVHSIMYSYYAIKATGRKIPQWISQVITMLQLCQMFMAITCVTVAYNSYHSGKDCDFQDEVFYTGMAIYGTYALLFLNFFYQRYVHGSKAE